MAATSAVNGLIFSTGLTAPAHAQPWFAPPGWAIGAVWTCLFVLFGIARWRLVPRSAVATRWLTLFMVWCLAYPLTSAGFDPAHGQVVNIVSLLFGAYVAVQARQADPTAALLLVPGLLWMVFATFLTGAVLLQG